MRRMGRHGLKQKNDSDSRESSPQFCSGAGPAFLARPRYGCPSSSLRSLERSGGDFDFRASGTNRSSAHPQLPNISTAPL